MRFPLVVVAIFPLLGAGCVDNVPDGAAADERLAASADVVQKPEPLSCTIRGERTCELGKIPKITVALTNQTSAAIYLVGSLDASDCKWRYPHSYFEVIGRDGNSAVRERVVRCGNMNPLREKDFVKVPPSGTFDPYQGGFFSAQQLSSSTFRTAGEYRIRYVYSTKSNTLGAWSGNAANAKLVSLFRQVPKVEVRSNEIKVTVVERGN